ncbi:MAG: 16S rRNA (adenine(1518)-N(6)/adenine(1519)-N(6))-dimethyltransferase RsmA [bacterium]
MTLESIKELCEKYNIYPSKSKGQNFLLRDDALEKITQAGDIKKEDTILEIGPGFGFLTRKLAEKGGNIISVELDKSLMYVAKKELKGYDNIRFINEDILKLSYDELKKLTAGREYKIIANIPYNITGSFLKKFFSINQKPRMMVLLIQKEVAERLCAPSGKKGEMSILGVSAQFYANPEIISIVDKSCFYPEPKVNSAIIKLVLREEFFNFIDDKDEKDFFRIVKIGFSSRRKMLKNNLLNGLKNVGVKEDDIENALLKCGLDLKARPQELTVDDWKNLRKALLTV